MQEIQSWASSLLLTNTPSYISPQIGSLCDELSPECQPRFVRVVPSIDAQIGECFYNVLRQVEREGGEIQYGWAIWEWPRVFVEAEHHAVWCRDGHLTDVTPQLPAVERILFLPDSQRLYDYERKRKLPNVKHSLGIIKATEQWLTASDKLQSYIFSNTHNNIAVLDQHVAEALHNSVLKAKIAILIELAETTRPNERCICGSGRKFKSCCSPKFGRLAY